jgi:hypothetical protein
VAHAVDGKTRAEMADTDLGDGACRDNMLGCGGARLSRNVVGKQVVKVRKM